MKDTEIVNRLMDQNEAEVRIIFQRKAYKSKIDNKNIYKNKQSKQETHQHQPTEFISQK